MGRALAYLKELTHEQVEQLTQVFAQMDKDRSGKLESREIFKVAALAVCQDAACCMLYAAC